MNARNRNEVAHWMRNRGVEVSRYPTIDELIKLTLEHCPDNHRDYVIPAGGKIRKIHRSRVLNKMAQVCTGAVGLKVVYFIGHPDIPYVKIGMTTNVAGRLAALQTGFPLPLRVYKTIRGGRKMEKQLHRKYKHLRSTGEWFRLDGTLLKELLIHTNLHTTLATNANTP